MQNYYKFCNGILFRFCFFYRGRELAKRLEEREKEMEMDAKDRQKEKEELAELKNKIYQDSDNPDIEFAKVRRLF